MLSRRFWNIAATAILTVCGARGETPSDVMRLPAPTGSYGVGHTDHLWIDTSRAAREIVLRVWYPTDGDAAQGVPWLERFEQAKAVLGETALRKTLRFGYPAVAAG